ncbi:MAG: DoxX family protein [Proteobacteria bacterium]|nr:DoxX family protein [Pseudomonadota bacterium]
MADKPNKLVHYGLWASQVLLALVFLMAGGMKLVTSQPDLVEAGMAWAGRIPEPGGKIIGLLEVLGAIGLIVPAATKIKPVLTPIAAACLALTMLVAGAEHAVAGELEALPANIVLGLFSAGIAVGRIKLSPIE